MTDVLRRLRLRTAQARDDERGLVLVFVLLFGVVMFGMLALAVDIGNVRQERRQAQTGADASSLAAAQIIEKYGPNFTGVPGQWVEVVAQVKGYARQNWGVKSSDWVGCDDENALTFKPDAGNGNSCISADYQVWPALPADVSAPPDDDTPPAAIEPIVNRVRVRLPQRSVTTAFGAVLGSSSLSTSASATAAVTRSVEWTLQSKQVTSITPPSSTTVRGGPCALCILGTGLTLDGQNGDVTISGGDVVVNSRATTAATLNPNGHVKVTSSDGKIGGPNAPANFSGSGYSPAPEYHDQVDDPLYLVPQCGNGSYGSPNDTTPAPAPMSPPPSECNPGINRGTSGTKGSTLQPGIYSSIKDSHTLSPGVYILKGDITLNGNDVLQGSGVMLYMACRNYPTPCAPGETGAGIKTTGNGYLKLTAPPTCTASPSAPGCVNYAGLTLFADRNNTATQTYRGNGTNENGPNSAGSGTIYIHGGTLDLRGNGYSLASMIVINTLSMQGNPSAVTISYDLNSNYETTHEVTTPGTEYTVTEFSWHAVPTDDNTGLVALTS